MRKHVQIKDNYNDTLIIGIDEDGAVFLSITEGDGCAEVYFNRKNRALLITPLRELLAELGETPAKAKSTYRPHGPQEYRGNGKHSWERVYDSAMEVPVKRLRVPGGWLYKTEGHAPVFVPLPEVVGYKI